jgi:hypothetical protein
VAQDGVRNGLAGGEVGLDGGNVDPLRRVVGVVGAQEGDVAYAGGLGEVQEAGDLVGVRDAQHGSHQIQPVHARQGVPVGGRVVPVKPDVSSAAGRGASADSSSGELPGKQGAGSAGAAEDQCGGRFVAHDLIIGASVERIHACSARFFV